MRRLSLSLSLIVFCLISFAGAALAEEAAAPVEAPVTVSFDDPAEEIALLQQDELRFEASDCIQCPMDIDDCANPPSGPIFRREACSFVGSGCSCGFCDSFWTCLAP